MGGIRISSLALVALLTIPAPAAAADLCADLNRIAAAAHEARPFASLQRALAADEEIVPGFAAGRCQIEPGVQIICSSHAMGVGQFDDWPDPLACPGVTALPAAERRSIRVDWVRVYAVSDLRFEFGVECGRCAGLATSQFAATLERPARRRR